MEPLSAEAQDLLNRYNLMYDEVLFYESSHQIGKYCLLTGITMMLWDHITTIPLTMILSTRSDEIKYVWQVEERWTLVTAIFGFNRYISPVGFMIRFAFYLIQNPERPICALNTVAAHWNIISFACVEFVLMLRVWVIYGRDRKLGIFLSTIGVVALMVSLILHYKEPLMSISVVPSFPERLTLCTRSSSGSYFWLFIIAASLETITLSLFCAKVYFSWRNSLGTPILSAFIAQGATYYFVVLCFFGISIAATMSKKMFLPLIDPNTVILVSCIACSRLVLSLRGLFHSHVAFGPTTVGTETMGEYQATCSVRVTVLSTWFGTLSTLMDTSTTATHYQRDERIDETGEQRADLKHSVGPGVSATETQP